MLPTFSYDFSKIKVYYKNLHIFKSVMNERGALIFGPSILRLIFEKKNSFFLIGDTNSLIFILVRMCFAIKNEDWSANKVLQHQNIQNFKIRILDNHLCFLCQKDEKNCVSFSQKHFVPFLFLILPYFYYSMDFVDIENAKNLVGNR